MNLLCYRLCSVAMLHHIPHILMALQCTQLHRFSAVCRDNAQGVNHPTWQNSLRYSAGAGDEVVVQIGAAKLAYGFEYLGTEPSQLTTRHAMTHRTFLGLANALHLRLVGTVVGRCPSG